MKNEKSFEEILLQTKSGQKKARWFSIAFTTLAIIGSMALILLAVAQTAQYVSANQRAEKLAQIAESRKMAAENAAAAVAAEKQRADESAKIAETQKTAAEEAAKAAVTERKRADEATEIAMKERKQTEKLTAEVARQKEFIATLQSSLNRCRPN